MRYIMIFLLFIFINCKKEQKNETKTESETKNETEKKIDVSVKEMWSNFTKSNPEFKNEKIPESNFFHNNKEDADRLAELTVNGKKKASSGLYSLYKQYNVELLKVGDKQIITNFEGKAKAIIIIQSIDTIPFNEISKEYAGLDMGTSIEPLKKWKKAHWGFFENFMRGNGGEPTEDMLIVCERFEAIWTKKY